MSPQAVTVRGDPSILVSPWSPEGCLSQISAAFSGIATPASAVWDTTNRAVYLPVYISAPCIAVKVWWANGATVNGNVDCGLYTSGAAGPLTKLFSAGTTAQAGASVVQIVDITDVALAAGVYYIGLVSSSATGTFIKSSSTSTQVTKALAICNQVTALPLPATATPAVASGTVQMPLAGFAMRTLI